MWKNVYIEREITNGRPTALKKTIPTEETAKSEGWTLKR